MTAYGATNSLATTLSFAAAVESASVVLATVAELEALGCRDPELHALAERLKAAGGDETKLMHDI